MGACVSRVGMNAFYKVRRLLFLIPHGVWRVIMVIWISIILLSNRIFRGPELLLEPSGRQDKPKGASSRLPASQALPAEGDK